MTRWFITGAMVLHKQLRLRSQKVVGKDESLYGFISGINTASSPGNCDRFSCLNKLGHG
jgi:hypothetical protein